MRELVIAVRELLAKGNEATWIDYLKVADMVIHLILDSAGGPIIGETEDQTADLIAASNELMQEHGAVGSGPIEGPAINILLPILLKFLLEQFLNKK